MPSKKPSATRRHREPVVFFIDRSLGRKAGTIFRQSGAVVEFHDDHFAQDATDVEWLMGVGKKGWAVVTKDKRIRYRPLERDALLAAGLRVFVLAASKNLTGEQMGEMLARNLGRMEKVARKQSPPFIAGVYERQVVVYDLDEQ